MAKKSKPKASTESVALVPTAREFPALKASLSSCNKVWSGVIARLRIYDQPGSTGKKVFVYIAPGGNSNYVGYTDDANMITALFAARNNQTSVQGYTNASCRMEWMDY